MKIERDNISKLPINEQKRVLSLLRDIDDINAISKISIYIDWQDFHDNWSDGPDYYGYYRLKTFQDEPIGLELDIETLDDCLCVLYDYLVL